MLNIELDIISKTRQLYLSNTPWSRSFRGILLIIDLVAIGYFLTNSFIEWKNTPLERIIEIILGLVFLFDLLARLAISRSRLPFIFNIMTLADVIATISLLLPLVAENFAFLRILRAARLIRSYHLLASLSRQSKFWARNEEVITNSTHLLVFIFICTALVYNFQFGKNPQITSYFDALYFTITTLTTTGFGDITLVGDGGRLVAVLIMLFGISLFLRLAQAIFRPPKIRFSCQTCGLSRHEPDAVHCKHCGSILNVPNDEGDMY